MFSKSLQTLALLLVGCIHCVHSRDCWVVQDDRSTDSSADRHAAFATWTSPDSHATLSYWEADQPHTTKKTVAAHSNTFYDRERESDQELLIHHVRVTDLRPQTNYEFDCGCSYSTPPAKPIHLSKKLDTIPTYGPEDPQQVHLSFGADGRTEMTVTWSTMTLVNSGLLFQEISQNETDWFQVAAETTEFNSQTHVQYIHRVFLTGLKPSAKYHYVVGNFAGGATHTSELFTFHMMSDDPQWTPRLAVYGDFGLVNDRSLPLLQKDVAAGILDGIIHVGDFAYDLHYDNGTYGDAWFNMVQSVYANVPVMTVPGNHEEFDNFTDYNNRFTMPATPFPEGIMSPFYSFDMGPIHFVAISTEVFFDSDQIYGHVHAHQLEFLEQDLAKANQNREAVPWIVVYGHRPMYCSPNVYNSSRTDTDDCHSQTSLVRDGFLGVDGYELRLRKYGVDLAVWGHEHAYERLWPTYQFQNFNGTVLGPYFDYEATVHVIAGSAGCHEDIEDWLKEDTPWVAYKSGTYGYGRLTATSNKVLHWEQIDDRTGNIEDSFDLARLKHGPFSQ